MVTGSKKTWPGDFSLSYNPVKMTWWLAYHCCFVCSSNKTRIYTTCLSLLVNSHTQNNYLKLVRFHIPSSLSSSTSSLSLFPSTSPAFLPISSFPSVPSFFSPYLLSFFFPSFLPTRIYMYLKPAFFCICYNVHVRSMNSLAFKTEYNACDFNMLTIGSLRSFFFRKHSQQSNSSGDRNFPKSTAHTWPSLCWLFCTTL